MTNRDRIAHFFSVVAEAQRQALAAEPFHTRLILFALLDALSHTSDPSNSANRLRFVSFIDDCAHSHLSSTFSVRQLSFLLAEPSAPASNPLCKPLQEDIATRALRFSSLASPVFSEDIDPQLHELQKFLDPDLERYIDKARYPNLLWTMRNSLVHELRELGEGFDFGSPLDQPYYHKLLHDDGVTETWELFIPTPVLLDVLSAGITALRATLEAEDKNPWDAFPYQYKWYS